MSRRVVWITGPFGVGKSTTAIHVLAANPGWRYFDPEQVGYMLRAMLGADATGDFRDLPEWRRLVPLVAAAVAARTGEDLLAVQTVTSEDHWRELSTGLDEAGFDVSLVVLDCDDEVLRSRIEADTVDPGAAEWRFCHVDEFVEALPWLVGAADAIIDTSSITAEEAADEIGDVLTRL